MTVCMYRDIHTTTLYSWPHTTGMPHLKTKSYLKSIFWHLLTGKYVYHPVDCSDILNKHIPTVYLTAGNQDTASDNLSMTNTTETKLRKNWRPPQLASSKVIWSGCNTDNSTSITATIFLLVVEEMFEHSCKILHWKSYESK